MEKHCQTPGCKNPLSKPDHPLCLDCWKKQRYPAKGSAKPSAASSADGGAKHPTPAKNRGADVYCQTEGCGNRVSKPGHSLCFDCWKKQQKGELPVKSPQDRMLSSVQIAEHFGITRMHLGAIFTELGWLERTQKGWDLTAKGEMWAEQRTSKTGKLSVVWSPVVLRSRILFAAVSECLGKDAAQPAPSPSGAPHDPDDFRKKFRGNILAEDGHWVSSRAELAIDNFLYNKKIVHAYERKLPVDENFYCDFYLPGGDVWIEYWGLENDPRYVARKERKIEVYDKNGLELIQLGDKELNNLGDHLTRELLKYGIKVK